MTASVLYAQLHASVLTGQGQVQKINPCQGFIWMVSYVCKVYECIKNKSSQQTIADTHSHRIRFVEFWRRLLDWPVGLGRNEKRIKKILNSIRADKLLSQMLPCAGKRRKATVGFSTKCDPYSQIT